MNLFQNMRAFVAVADSGSFTSAALQLDTTTANLSRAVSNLEDHLQTRLLHRTTRRIALTEAGSRYRLRCEQILASVADAELEAGGAQARPSGTLKVHAMTGIGMHYVIDAMAEYRELYPQVAFDLTLSNRMPDLLVEGYDLSIVLADKLPDSGFVSQGLGQISSVLCAAPRYLLKHGVPQRPADLGAHLCLGMVGLEPMDNQWLFDGPDGQQAAPLRDPPFTANAIDAMSVAIRSGMGLGVLPSYSAIDGLRAGTLKRVLPEYRLRTLNLYAIYPSRQFLDAKIKTWVEHLRATLPEALAAEERDLLACG
jgi:DNA-binding transcriptional LysR family regulator